MRLLAFLILIPLLLLLLLGPALAAPGEIQLANHGFRLREVRCALALPEDRHYSVVIIGVGGVEGPH